VTVITVLLSVILHGATAGPIGAAFGRRAAARQVVQGSESTAGPSQVLAGHQSGQGRQLAIDGTEKIRQNQ